ncbi:hypothetical protein [Paenibacillus ginsengarvi]|uniref:Uncharacterized protein n=1 Tax=Paenibacillus ginsengarvi TaxID=400777 RepID=A0A3B0CJ32_9BACL|nr:hypothetical protein [Paenibacillus ginsengarvi]RKN83986.1 hypothetical protein D7M11_15515 [Paenibacillus ginsengarvi]
MQLTDRFVEALWEKAGPFGILGAAGAVLTALIVLVILLAAVRRGNNNGHLEHPDDKQQRIKREE